ncbi:MAG: hypothetical protein IPK82_24375 [Polyangiaceae bacterium]|nr:hypothetical protein [Polyangiaceae bacterium]
MSALADETQALLDDLIASLPTAPPEMRPIVEAQIRNAQDSLRMLKSVEPQMAQNKQFRPQLTPQVQAFFTSAAGPDIPTWVADTLMRSDVSEHILRCPQGARVYEDELNAGCAIPRGIGSIPMRQGISLAFYHSGRLRSQAFYERGLLRWSISYHANGGRENRGLYCDRVEREHLAHGLHTTQCSTGAVTAQSYWHLGIHHGWTKLWEEDGFPIGATLYEQGREIDWVMSDGSRRPS